MPGYQPRGRATADKLQQDADSAFEEGRKANTVSDDFGQANLALTTALALAGIAQVFRKRHVRFGLVAVAAVALLFGALRLVILPTIFLGLSQGS